MSNFFIYIFLVIVFFAGFLSKGIAQDITKSYICMPCGSSCDAKTYDKSGSCKHCGMTLVPQKSVVFTNVTPIQVCELVRQNSSIVFLDVRTAEEFNGTTPKDSYGHIKNAINIPIQELESRLKELAAFKNKEIIVYCSHSHRSPQAAYLLSTNGFTKVKNMSGGMSIWLDSITDLKINKEIFIKHY